ncbi:MAG TPA: hypothetical protein VGQ21_10015 [Thermoanaerobaculia bacterium]|jgi:hypothetical protein|nr:hypothetical protein [Thermoanaerobaculia bacterium]
MNPSEERPEKAPSSFAADYGRRIRWFGIWFLVGLAPFLGKVKVPGFSALIELYPSSLQGWLIPLSGIFMGMMAVVVEFVGSRHTEEAVLSRWFLRNAVVFLLALLLLVSVYTFTVVQMERSVGRGSNEVPEVVNIAVVTGSRTVPQQIAGSDCKCPSGQPAERCLADSSLKPDNVALCFGSVRIAFATLALVLLYLVVTGSFVAAIGLLLIRQRSVP